MSIYMEKLKRKKKEKKNVSFQEVRVIILALTVDVTFLGGCYKQTAKYAALCKCREVVG